MYGMPGKNRGKTAGLYPIRNSGAAKAMFFFASPPLRFDRHDIQPQKQILAKAGKSHTCSKRCGMHPIFTLLR